MISWFKYRLVILILILSLVYLLGIPIFCTLKVFAAQEQAQQNRTLTELRAEYETLQNSINFNNPPELLPENLVTAYQNARNRYNTNQTEANRMVFLRAAGSYLGHLGRREERLRIRSLDYQSQLQVVRAMQQTVVRQGEQPLNAAWATGRINELNRLIPQYQSSLDRTTNLLQEINTVVDRVIKGR